MTRIVLNAENLEKSFRLHMQGGVILPVLSQVSLQVHAGECIALHGRSGAGKSTLMKALFGNYRIDAGRIQIWHGDRMVDVSRCPPREMLAVRRDTLAYVSQFLRVVPRVATIDLVAEVLIKRGVEHAAAHQRARDFLEQLNVPRRLHHLPPATFSGGEQQRVNLARGLIGGHPVVLLDEPTASLDADNRAVVAKVIKDAKKSGRAVVGIFHDAAIRDAVADRVVEVGIA